MNIGRRDAKIVLRTLNAWQESGILDASTRERLADSLNPVFDKKRLSFHLAWITALLFAAAIVAVTWDYEIYKWFMEKPPELRALGGFVAAVIFFVFGFRIHSKTSSGVLVFLGCMALASGVAQTAECLEMDDTQLWIPSGILALAYCMGSRRSMICAVFCILALLLTGCLVKPDHIESWPLRFLLMGVLSAAVFRKNRCMLITASIFAGIGLVVLSIAGHWNGVFNSNNYDIVVWTPLLVIVGILLLRKNRLAGIALLMAGLVARYIRSCWDTIPAFLFFLLPALALAISLFLLERRRTASERCPKNNG